MEPKFGDVIINEMPDGRCEVVDALALTRLSNDFATLDAAVAVARMRGARVWLQPVESSGPVAGRPVPAIGNSGVSALAGLPLSRTSAVQTRRAHRALRATLATYRRASSRASRARSTATLKLG